MGNVAQRASLLWSGRKPQNPPRSSTGLGRHAVLSSRESVDGVPLDDIHDASTIGNDDDNPFDSPTETIGPFSVSTELQDSPVMNPSSEPPTPPISKNLPDRPDLEPSLTTRQPPPPQPLGLPAPVAPPPRVDIPNSDQPPHLTPPLSVRPSSPVEEDVKETRWWHDWLCGCSEGPDRGGDSQVGRCSYVTFHFLIEHTRLVGRTLSSSIALCAFRLRVQTGDLDIAIFGMYTRSVMSHVLNILISCRQSSLSNFYVYTQTP